MKRRISQIGAGLRDAFRDRVWQFARRIDPAVGQEQLADAEVVEDLTRYAMVGMPLPRRTAFILLASPREAAEAALRKAAREGFEGTLADAAERAKEIPR